MANQFSTMSIEMIDREIKKFEEKMHGRPSEQDKLMLFALKTEYEQRQKEARTSDITKIRNMIDEIENAQMGFDSIDISRISSEELIPILLKFYHSQVEFVHKLNKIIDDRTKKD